MPDYKELQIPEENLELFLGDKGVQAVLGKPTKVLAELFLEDYLIVDLEQHVKNIDGLKIKEVRSRLDRVKVYLEEQEFTNEYMRGLVKSSPNSEFTRHDEWKGGEIIITVKGSAATVKYTSEIPPSILYHTYPYVDKTVKELLEMTTSDLPDPFEYAKVRIPRCIATQKKLRAGEFYVIDPSESETEEEADEIESVTVIDPGNRFMRILKDIFIEAYKGPLMVRGNYFPSSNRLEADEILKIGEQK